MSIITIWESRTYSDDSDGESRCSFVPSYILEYFFDTSAFPHRFWSDEKTRLRICESIIYDILPHRLETRATITDKIDEENLLSALAFCSAGGLKNREFTEEIIRNFANHDEWRDLVRQKVLSKDELGQPIEQTLPKILKYLPNYGIPGKYLHNAEELFHSKSIPYTNSPLSAESIAGLLSKSAYVSAGAFVGYLVIDPSPLLLLTMPAGMVIFGAASGIASGLEKGLKEMVVNYLVKETIAKKKKGR